MGSVFKSHSCLLFIHHCLQSFFNMLFLCYVLFRVENKSSYFRLILFRLYLSHWRFGNFGVQVQHAQLTLYNDLVDNEILYSKGKYKKRLTGGLTYQRIALTTGCVGLNIQIRVAIMTCLRHKKRFLKILPLTGKIGVTRANPRTPCSINI